MLLWPSLRSHLSLQVTPRDLRNIHTTVGTYFHIWHSTKTTPVFLTADGEASWSLLPSLASLLWQVRSEKGKKWSFSSPLKPISLSCPMYFYTWFVSSSFISIFLWQWICFEIPSSHLYVGKVTEECKFQRALFL